jgi:hypothetical protein
MHFLGYVCIYTYIYIYIYIYSHFSGVPWLIKTGSGLDDWFYWRHLLQSFVFTITTAHNQWLSNSLHSWLNYECLLFCVTDLVLIYELVTSSASAVRWFTLHSWTLNSLTIGEWLNSRMKTYECPLFCNSGRTEERPPPWTVRLLLLSVATTRVSISWQRFDFYKCISWYETHF